MAAQGSPSSASDALHDRPDQGVSAFEQAARHSRRVQRLKIVLPAAAVLLAVCFVAASYVLSPVSVKVDVSDSAYVDGKLVMASPQLEGMTKENRPYEMKADRAVQEAATPGVIQLETVSAKLPLNTQDWVSIEAPEGVYDRDRNTLDMKTPFRITSTNGVNATINSAFVDMGNSTMKTADPVDIVLNGSRLTADSMSVLEKGKLFVFEKRVRLVIEPGRVNEMRSASGADKGATTGADGG